jgi:hypothetical protein
MRITKHEKSYIVELSDSSVWRIWPTLCSGYRRLKLMLKKLMMRFVRMGSSTSRTDRKCV